MTSDHTKWLDERCVQKLLRDSKKDESIEVTKITKKPATSKGDNYSSDMIRMSVVFSQIQNGKKITEDVSLIAKVLPQDILSREMVMSGGFFEAEISMMSNTLPKMVEILKSVTTPEIAAQCYQAQLDDPVHLIVEDLRSSGFQMFRFKTGLDLDHCLLALRNLALFHASSVALKEKDPEAVVNYKKGILSNSVLEIFFSAGTRTLADHASEWPELDKRISEKLIKLSDVVVEKGRAATDFREDDFNVLNHGDFWTNNMMFRYNEEGKPTAHIFVDFQIPYYGSAALDLLYFLSLSPSDEVRANHRELLLREYHALLTSTMAKLKCSTEAPSLDKLKKIMRERGHFTLGIIFTMLPVICTETNEAISLGEMISPEGKFQHPGFMNPLFRKIMTRALPEYDSMGLLDVDQDGSDVAL